MRSAPPDNVKSILVGTGTGFGNVLLATPLIRSLRRAYPEARLDVLTLRGRSAILVGNPDINHIIEVGRKEGAAAAWHHLRRIAGRYDISLSTQVGDRWVMNSCLAGHYRSSHLLPEKGVKWWQRLWLSDHVFKDVDTHIVLNCLQLVEPLNIPRWHKVVPPSPINPQADIDALQDGGKPYAVLHLFPRNPYKCWSDRGWQALIRHLIDRDMRIAVTGGGDEQEQAYVSRVLDPFPGAEVRNLAGKLTFQEVTGLLNHATIYIGVDTAITHLAAATGIPVVAIYSPANPITYWGPWPSNYDGNTTPYAPAGTQHAGNITLIHTADTCKGCPQDCLRDYWKECPCLQALTPETVIQHVDKRLTT